MESTESFAHDWHHALTLRERSTLLRNHRPDVVGARAGIAGLRADSWRRQPPFSKGSYFEQRLALAELTEAEFLSLVDTPVALLGDGLSTPPGWLCDLVSAFRHSPRDLGAVAGGPRDALAAFVEPLEPLLRHSLESLTQGVRSLVRRYAAPFDENTVRQTFSESLSEQLADMVGRTLTLELHVARFRNLLNGETSEQRFRSFVTLLKQPDAALGLLREYPVLARQLTVTAQRWLDVSVELLERLCVDWADIRGLLGPDEEPGQLVSCHAAGDAHAGGRHVAILRFGSGLQVVYKPRSLALDIHFQELLTWMNRRGQDPPFRTLRILNRDGYGWIECVTARTCTTALEVRRFYERQGSNLALLYLLNATDFHHENLIAVGEHPMLIDLETLFHSSPANPAEGAVRTAAAAMADSVLRVGLLPQRVWATDHSEGIDISGLGTAEGQASPFMVPQLEDVGTDVMRWTRQRVTLGAEPNQPQLGGAPIDVRDYVDAVTAGFTATYRLLLRHRDDLLATDSPLARFVDDDVRIVLRATHTYASLRRESFHPDVLRDALDRDRLFDRLWIRAEQQPHLIRAIQAESRDLEDGDIPIFRTRPDSRDLWTSSGERLADFFDESGISVVRRRLSRFDAADLERQLWYIGASFTSLYARLEDDGEESGARMDRAAQPATPDQLLRAARAVGDRLKLLAIQSNGEAAWIGLTQSSRHRSAIAPLSIDLYDGLPGVVLFLAYLGAITEDRSYTTLAQEGLASIRRVTGLSRSLFKTIGGFSGWGGLVYTLTSLGLLWRDPRLHEEAADIAEHLTPLIEQDDQLDVVGGAAGCLASLIGLHHVRPSERTRAAASRCGEHLLATAQAMAAGVAWRIQGQPRPLTGFSHGAAGIAWALLGVSELSGDDRYRAAAIAAIEYERSLFSPEHGNWPDLREIPGYQSPTSQAPFMAAWCHGAAGIGLARALLVGRLDDPSLASEVRVAVHTTLARSLGQNHSLCHGDLGNLDTLLQAGQWLGDTDLQRHAYRMAAVVLGDVERNGWRCGVPAGVESPGLMTGLAGIGYQFLRLADPRRVPSVLCLATPLPV